MNHERSASPRRTLARSALAVGAALLVLLGAEGVVRGLGLAPAYKAMKLDEAATVYRRSTNPVLAYELKPGYRSAAADLVTSYPFTNSHGQRDVERTLARPAGVRRIVVLGDSVVEGEKIREIDDTLTRQLELLYGSPTVEVLNFGVAGYCTLAEVELLRVKALAFDPDVVVLVFVENDFDNYNRQLFELGGSVARPAGVETLFRASSLFRLLCVQNDWFHFGADVRPLEWNAEAIGDNNVVQGLELLRELADRHGFAPLVVVWPRFLDDAVADVHVLEDGEELIVERLCRTNGLPVFRLAPYFREALRAAGGGNPRLRFTAEGDTMHPSVEGCRVAAAALKDLLDRLPAALPRGPRDAAAVAAARARGQAPAHSGAELNNVGLALYREGRLDEAVQAFRNAIAAKPDSEFGYNNLGSVLHALGRDAEAEEELRQALVLRPDYAEAHYNLGLVLEARGVAEEAALHYRRALERSPDMEEARLHLGVAERACGELDRAEEVFREVLRRGTAPAAGHFQLAVTLLAQAQRARSFGPVREAAQHFRSALELEPEHAGAREGLTSAEKLLAKEAEGIAQLREELAERPGDRAVLGKLVGILLQAGDAPAAVAELEAALERQPGDPELLNRCAWLLATLPDAGARDGARAVRLAERAAELTARRDASVLDTLAAAYAEAGRFAEAQATAAEAAREAQAAGDAALLGAIEQRAALYAAGRPVREP